MSIAKDIQMGHLTSPTAIFTPKGVKVGLSEALLDNEVPCI
jgi:hypothetical protein